jgi:ribosome-associated toxin RatA of RatAB toxin-antitoxin module
MATLTGSSSAEIDAPLDAVWKVVEDVSSAPDWQGGLEAMDALERDAEGRPTLCETESDAKVRTVRTHVRFDYSGAPHELRWTQEKGDLKSVEGSWKLEDLGDGRTRATYALAIDPGRMLGMLVRGPVEDLVRAVLVNARAGELKQRMESGG